MLLCVFNLLIGGTEEEEVAFSRPTIPQLLRHFTQTTLVSLMAEEKSEGVMRTTNVCMKM